MNTFSKHEQYPMLPVLIVDDEANALISVEMSLRSGGINNILKCEDSSQVIPTIKEQDVQIILLDLIMPHISGEELLIKIKQDFPEIPIIIITGLNELDLAVRCMKLGADDYIVKPVETRRLLSCVQKTIEFRELQRENTFLKERIFTNSNLEHPEIFSEIITNNDTMYSIFHYCEAIANTPQPVLITGETGAGKELIAKAIHNLSKREGDYIAVNIAGLDEAVFADTLFGHKKGAFTGANDARSGMVEKASAGTLFLDEIGDLHLSSQVKLLRLLQEKEYFPIGSDIAKRNSARIITATLKDIKQLHQSENFRSDLYYRLHTHHIHVPPLRERKGDIPLLIEHLLEKTANFLNKPTPTPPSELINLLNSYHFPGNVRELESMVYDAVSVHTSKKLSMEAFKSRMGLTNSGLNRKIEQKEEDSIELLSFHDKLPTIKMAEAMLVNEAMNRSQGKQSIAANLLGITRQALHQRLKRIPK